MDSRILGMLFNHPHEVITCDSAEIGLDQKHLLLYTKDSSKNDIDAVERDTLYMLQHFGSGSVAYSVLGNGYISNLKKTGRSYMQEPDSVYTHPHATAYLRE
ncbi:hypothetical protein VNO77_22999 [Canavalia gladiata]|uniref:Uncharacterized protein n=1 Tax=Canavalia gladiata TaxID=3824 RepID=A0AAN9L543_CANGL